MSTPSSVSPFVPSSVSFSESFPTPSSPSSSALPFTPSHTTTSAKPCDAEYDAKRSDDAKHGGDVKYDARYDNDAKYDNDVRQYSDARHDDDAKYDAKSSVGSRDQTASKNMLKDRLDTSLEVLRERLGSRQPSLGIILGSGLGPLADHIQDAVYIPFAEVPFMKTSTASSHVGRFVCGTLSGKCVLAMQGRLHGYEGNEAWEVAYPVWLMQRLGIETLITTNAAGAINETYQVGDFCLMEDHINLTGRNPIVGTDPDGIAPRFVPMKDAYDPALRAIAKQVAEQLSIRVQEGVYLGLLGPSFETPAEIRAFRILGADTVAMSVVEEVIAARHVGLKVLGMSLVSNMACGVEGASPNDDEVLEVAQAKENDFVALIKGIVAQL